MDTHPKIDTQRDECALILCVRWMASKSEFRRQAIQNIQFANFKLLKAYIQKKSSKMARFQIAKN